MKKTQSKYPIVFLFQLYVIVFVSVGAVFFQQAAAQAQNSSSQIQDLNDAAENQGAKPPSVEEKTLTQLRDERKLELETQERMAIAAEAQNSLQHQSNTLNSKIAIWTGIAAVSAIVAAGAAIVAVLLARDTDRRTLRAYVVADPGVFVDQDRSMNRRISISRKIVNTGQTPAYEVATVFQAKIWDVEFFEQAKLFEVKAVGTPASNTIGPGREQEVSWNSPDFFDDAEMDAARACDKKRLYVFGLVTYKDAFGKLRRTEFCDYVTRGPKGGLVSVNTGKYSKAT